jgi:hypothetical protein
MSMACTVTYQRPWHGAEHTYMPWTLPPMLLHAMYTSLHAMEICVHGMESFPLLMYGRTLDSESAVALPA